MYDIDQQTGIIEKYSKEDGKIKVYKTQDVKPFLAYTTQHTKTLQAQAFKVIGIEWHQYRLLSLRCGQKN